jgi:hypothetical protein
MVQILKALPSLSAYSVWRGGRSQPRRYREFRNCLFCLCLADIRKPKLRGQRKFHGPYEAIPWGRNGEGGKLVISTPAPPPHPGVVVRMCLCLVHFETPWVVTRLILSLISTNHDISDDAFDVKCYIVTKYSLEIRYYLSFVTITDVTDDNIAVSRLDKAHSHDPPGGFEMTDGGSLGRPQGVGEVSETSNHWTSR